MELAHVAKVAIFSKMEYAFKMTLYANLHHQEFAQTVTKATL